MHIQSCQASVTESVTGLVLYLILIQQFTVIHGIISHYYFIFLEVYITNFVTIENHTTLPMICQVADVATVTNYLHGICHDILAKQTEDVRSIEAPLMYCIVILQRDLTCP